MRKFAPSRQLPLAEGSEEPGSPHLVSSFSEALQRCLLFRRAPQSFYHAVFNKMALVTHAPGQYLMRYGEPAKLLYVLLKGTVTVTLNDGETVFAELGPGLYFGEIGVLFLRPRTATVVAKTKSLCAAILLQTLQQLFPKYPHLERAIRDEAQNRLAGQERKKSPKLDHTELTTKKPSEPQNDSLNIFPAARKIAEWLPGVPFGAVYAFAASQKIVQF